MPLFRYRAISESGSLVRGEQVASSLDGLEEDLAARGLLLQKGSAKWLPAHLPQRGRVKAEDLLHLCQELSSLFRAGLTVPAALGVASERPGQPRLEKTLNRVREDVRQGSQLSEALGQHPEIFDSLLLAAVRTGEKMGELAPALARYQESLRRRIELQRKISQAFAYPIFLLVTTAIALGILFVFVLPRFTELYAGFGAQIPWPTRMLMTVVENLGWFLGLFLVVGVGGWFAFRFWTSSVKGRRRWDRFKAGLPFIGALLRARSSAHLARVLGDLQAAGTPLVAAIRTASETHPDKEGAARLEKVGEMVAAGEGVGEALRQEALLPPTALKMVEAGEASSDLERLFREVSDFLEEDLTHRLSRMMALVEPALMLGMGVLIGGIILVMYLPIFRLASVVQ